MKLVELARFSPDVAATADFYRRLLGVDPANTDADIAAFRVEGLTLLVHAEYTPDADGPLPPTDHVAFAVDDLEADCARLVAAGLSLEAPPRDYPWGRSAYLRDPDGRQIEIAQAR